VAAVGFDITVQEDAGQLAEVAVVARAARAPRAPQDESRASTPGNAAR
jgi:hypothetical protein